MNPDEKTYLWRVCIHQQTKYITLCTELCLKDLVQYRYGILVNYSVGMEETP
jgi:hypothetical protein